VLARSMRLCSAFLLPVLVFLGGCGSNAPKIVQVTGSVCYHGQPVPNLYVTFTPEEGRPSWAVTDEAGHFTLRLDRKTEGAHVGLHKVTFAFRPRDPKQEMEYHEGKRPLPPEMQAVLDKYGTDNPVEQTVTSNGQVIDINLD